MAVQFWKKTNKSVKRSEAVQTDYRQEPAPVVCVELGSLLYFAGPHRKLRWPHQTQGNSGEEIRKNEVEGSEVKISRVKIQGSTFTIFLSHFMLYIDLCSVFCGVCCLCYCHACVPYATCVISRRR